jgi:hypothetical protein
VAAAIPQSAFSTGERPAGSTAPPITTRNLLAIRKDDACLKHLEFEQQPAVS